MEVGGIEMTIIGVVNEEELQPEMQEKLENYEINVQQGVVVGDLQKKSDILFIEESAENLANSCVRFLHCRQQVEGFVWVMVKGTSKITRQMYFELGADGVFDENCSIDEIVLCVKNGLERQQLMETKYKKRLEKLGRTSDSSILLNREARSVRILATSGWQEIILTEIEFQLIDILYHKIGLVCFYEELYKKFWAEEVEYREIYLANLIFRIRMKFKRQGVDRAVIETVRLKGYRLLEC